MTATKRVCGILPLLAAAALWLPQAMANDPVRGAKVYQQHCLNCHGAGGMATWPGAPNFARREGVMRADTVLRERIRNGRGACPSYRGILNDQAIQDVIVYIRTLAR